jgi:hypothetical protein
VRTDGFVQANGQSRVIGQGRPAAHHNRIHLRAQLVSALIEDRAGQLHRRPAWTGNPSIKTHGALGYHEWSTGALHMQPITNDGLGAIGADTGLHGDAMGA